MVFFGTLKTADGRIIHNGTVTDEIMNYACGGVLIAYLVIGIFVNLQLIYYYKDNRPSWIDRYLFYISSVRLVKVIVECSSVIYLFLNTSPVSQVATVDSEDWKIIANFLTFLCFTALIGFDTVIVAIQYSNIHRPLWALLADSYSRLVKYGLITVSTVFTVDLAVTTIYGQINKNEEFFTIPIPKKLLINIIISNIPFLLLGLIIIGIYSTTWVRFWYQTGGVSVSQIIMREFKLISVLVVSDSVCFVSIPFFLVNLASMSDANICRSMYVYFFSGTMVSQTSSVVAACYMLLSDRNIRNMVLGRCC